MPVRSRLKHLLLFFSPAIIAIALDQLTKFWVKHAIPLGGSIPASGFFRITHVQNTGAAFGIFPGSISVLAVVSAIGAVIVLWLGLFMYRRLTFLDNTLTIIALGMILGGTLGNFIDRAFIGYVTDFIKMGPWPDYNIADASEVVGSVILAITLFRSALKENPDGVHETTSC